MVQGYLDIHHISAGWGNATYIVMPDGTTMLVDAGASDPSFRRAGAAPAAVPAPPLPDGAHGAGHWIANHIRQFAPAGRRVQLDNALITHFHSDHMKTVTPDTPISRTGAYGVAGITEAAESIPITTLIDRAAPSYDYPVDLHKCVAPGGLPGNSGLSLRTFWPSPTTASNMAGRYRLEGRRPGPNRAQSPFRLSRLPRPQHRLQRRHLDGRVRGDARLYSSWSRQGLRL